MMLAWAAVPAQGNGAAAAPSPESAGEAWTSNQVPSDEVLEARGAVIGDVRVITGDIFDPERAGEDNRIYHLTNRLHRTTRPAVVRNQLLFQEGDPFSRRAIEESARILRRNRYFYDAEIRLVGYRNNRVDIEVKTRDVWTFSPGISFGRSGGVNSADFKVQDYNLMGRGSSVTLKYISDIDRDTLFFGYRDDHFLGSWMKLNINYGSSTDGSIRRFEVVRPFYSLDTRQAWGVRFFDHDRVDSYYAQGVTVDHFQHDETVLEVQGGISRGLSDHRTRRWLTGVRYEQHRFGAATYIPRAPSSFDALADLLSDRVPLRDPIGDPKSLAEGEGVPIPEDRVLVYPWIGFETLSDKFTSTTSFSQMGRTEDLELGYRFRARLGYASRAFGGDRDAAILDSRFSIGFQPTERQTLLVKAEASGRWGREGSEDVRLSGRARFYWWDFGRHLLFVNVEADAVHNLDADDQLLLGGDSGLRGYPLRYQDGEQRLLVSIEQRFFTDLYPFRLFYVGGAVFLDVGQTWGRGISEDLGMLRNAGLGLRLSSSRSGQGSVIHLDVAFPLDGDDSIKSVQWLISTKSSF